MNRREWGGGGVIEYGLASMKSCRDYILVTMIGGSLVRETMIAIGGELGEVCQMGA